jgi:6-phosphogluconolactonase (cycloisomerase 2 family)
MVAIDPTGSFAYVAGGGQVAAFNIDSTTGALTAIPGSPFTAALNTLWVAVDPNGKFVYVTDHGSFGSGTTPGGISAYAIDPITGALTEIPGSPFPLPKGPTSITLVAVP